MTKKRRVPEVLWKAYRNRSRTLAETILSLIPPPLPAPDKCWCKGAPCLRCCCEGDRIAFLLTENDPSHYRKLLNHCFVVVPENAPPPSPFNPQVGWSQLQIVRRTARLLLCDNHYSKNLICTGFDRDNNCLTRFEKILTSDSWSLLLTRIGDLLMFYLLNYCSIFVPLQRNKHQQVAGNPINGLCWNIIMSKDKHPSSGVPEMSHEVDCISMNIDSSSCIGPTVKGSVAPSISRDQDTIMGADTKEITAQTKKRSRPPSWLRKAKRRKWLQEEKIGVPCPCCSVWQKLQKVPRKVNISKKSVLYQLQRGSSILPDKHKIYSLKPNVAGANALFREIFGISDVVSRPTSCSHNNDVSAHGSRCLYHSLHNLLKSLIRKTSRCRRQRLLNKHIVIPSIDQDPNESDSSCFENSPVLDHRNLYCSRSQVISFIWAACRSIVPEELLGTPSNWRVLLKTISSFVKLRQFEKLSIYQCLLKLKTSNFPFLSDKHAQCNMNNKARGSSIRNLLGRWIYWFFNFLVVPLIQANFYVTESQDGRLQVFFYEKSVWKKLMKSSILKEKCYSLLDLNAAERILRNRELGFSKVRFCPKTNGIRSFANLGSGSVLRTRHAYKVFKPVNTALRDMHAILKDIQFESPEKLGSSVFSYNDVYKKLHDFIARVKVGSNVVPCVYMVVADVRKAYDSIYHDRLLLVMKDVMTDADHLLHDTQQIIASNGHMQIAKCVNSSREIRFFFQERSSHKVLVDQGKSRTADKQDLHRRLQEHVKGNLVVMNNRFYKQNVGIPQGSIVSLLLCSFYLGHMENCKLLPYLEKVAKNNTTSFQNLLLRYVDDFIFISTSKKQAEAFLTRLERGFSEYNCSINREKSGSSFDDDNMSPPSNRVYIDALGNKFMCWSGLLINCKTLEVQADYTRYLDVHMSSTLTVRWQGNPVRYFKEKLCDYLQPKCHPIFYDSYINSADIVRLNIYQAFLVCAMKFHCYVRELSKICILDPGACMDIIQNSVRYMYRLMKAQMNTVGVDRRRMSVRKSDVVWLGLRAYIQVLKPKQPSYKELLFLLKSKLDSVDGDVGVDVDGNVPSALKFAVNKVNSAVLWKIKY